MEKIKINDIEGDNFIYIRYREDYTHVENSYEIKKRKEIKEICKIIY